MTEYTYQDLVSLYELGRLYFDMGYFAPSERIFNGLVEIDEGETPAQLGLGLIRLERSLPGEAITHFRSVLQGPPRYHLSAKFGLCSAFLSSEEGSRADSILHQIQREHLAELQGSRALRLLWEALKGRVG